MAAARHSSPRIVATVGAPLARFSIGMKARQPVQVPDEVASYLRGELAAGRMVLFTGAGFSSRR
jgi:hypothetical protein